MCLQRNVASVSTQSRCTFCSHLFKMAPNKKRLNLHLQRNVIERRTKWSRHSVNVAWILQHSYFFDLNPDPDSNEIICTCKSWLEQNLNSHLRNSDPPLYRVYQKKCPKWKIASTSDIPQNLGYFLQARISRSLLVYLGQKIIFPSKFMLPGGCFLSSNFEKACAQKCQPENGIFFNWLQVWVVFNKLSKFQKKWCLLRATRDP